MERKRRIRGAGGFKVERSGDQAIAVPRPVYVIVVCGLIPHIVNPQLFEGCLRE